MSQVKNKESYLQPKVKTVTFSVERGYNASLIEVSSCVQEYIDDSPDNHNSWWEGGVTNSGSVGVSEYSGSELGW